MQIVKLLEDVLAGEYRISSFWMIDAAVDLTTDVSYLILKNKETFGMAKLN